ncbi:STAS domain-containing protein [Aquimonas voraii]|uniref:ABC-type transporter Mla maintaining outer membrane lipid asymmetry, MlaB component, contains STAS domain n=1 Tax=Aquimonas voraii TaxID=265719 RepID=A0A1G6WT39_9GAMM|nr:STAS domain-containing protein [Aquimonas voraii]SDD69042.1 ABC-type transporter Mla maintaining outer membrane lipid asymmetry, MlaB component, contains STAS domain [Aquimonas voraii]
MSKAEPALRARFEAGVLQLQGRLGVDEAAQLLAETTQHAAGLQRIDLGALDDIDSAGVACLHLLQRQARAAGRTLVLQPVSPRYRAICIAHRLSID